MLRAQSERLGTTAAVVLLVLGQAGCFQPADDGAIGVDIPEGQQAMESFELTAADMTAQAARGQARLAAPLRLAWAEQSRFGRIDAATRHQVHSWRDGSGELVVDVIVRLEAGDPSVVGSLVAAGMDVGAVTSAPAMAMGAAPVARLAEVAAVDGVRSVEVARPMERHLSQSIGAGETDAITGAPVASMDLTRGEHANGAGVIVGVVDTGIDYRHQDFRLPGPDGSPGRGRTRVVSIWDQTSCGNEDYPTAPDGSPYTCVGAGPCGTEYSRDQIDCALGFEVEGGCAGLPPVLQVDSHGHGTHVASTAAGSGGAGEYVGVAPAAEIVFVKFDFDNDCDRNSSVAIVQAVAYIFDVAASLGRPAVVNLSLGSDLGPHTGLTGEEAGLNALSGPGRIVVAAAGNASRTAEPLNQVFGAPIHGSGSMVEGSTSTFGFTVPRYQVAALGGNYLLFDLWYGYGHSQFSYVTVEVSPPPKNPARRTWISFAPSPDPGWGRCQSSSSGRVCVFHSVAGFDPMWDMEGTAVDNEIWIVVDDESGWAPAVGDWQVRLVANDIAGDGPETTATYHSWMLASRNLELTTAVYGDGPADNHMTVGCPATASEVISVAAYTTRSAWYDYQGTYQEYGLAGTGPGYYDPMPLNELCFFSSHGPGRGPLEGLPVPDLAAPGGGIGAALSSSVVLAARTSSSGYYPTRVLVDGDADGLNGYVVMQGTSMATPHATGAVAVLLQRDPLLDPAGLRAVLEASSALEDGQLQDEWGRGRFDIDLALDSMACSADAQCDDGESCNGVELCEDEVCLPGERPACGLEDGCCPAGCDHLADADCSAPPTPEDCAAPGDEDGDGLADCDDPDCASFEACAPVCGDLDGDGYEDAACGGTDCDDGDGLVNPGATEICGDGIDNDCFGGDEECPPAVCARRNEACSVSSECCAGLSCNPKHRVCR